MVGNPLLYTLKVLTRNLFTNVLIVIPISFQDAYYVGFTCLSYIMTSFKCNFGVQLFYPSDNTQYDIIILYGSTHIFKSLVIFSDTNYMICTLFIIFFVWDCLQKHFFFLLDRFSKVKTMILSQFHMIYCAIYNIIIAIKHNTKLLRLQN